MKSPLLQSPTVPQIFDYQRFKSRIEHDHINVMKLQSILHDVLEERLDLFSRNFPVKITHDFMGCHWQEYCIEIYPEFIPFKQNSLDLVLNAGPLMFTNDVPGVLRQWYASLKPGGVFMAALLGEESLIELKECFFRAEEKLQIPHTARFLPTIATKDAGMLMQRVGFYLPTSDKTRITFKADGLKDILQSLKALGGNILHDRSKIGLSREVLQIVESEYIKHYSDNSGLSVTIDIVCMTGWAIERYAEERINQQTPKTLGYL